ncbi:MAG: helix-turn-helix domain-containing protein [Myxococcota bacterium]
MDKVRTRVLAQICSERERITNRLVDALCAELPEYRALPRKSVVAATAIDFDTFIEFLEEGRSPRTRDAHKSLDVARKRARSGFPLAVFLDSFNVARREAVKVVEEVGQELRLRVADRRSIERLVSDWTGLLMVQTSRAFLELAGGEEGTDDHRRELIVSLLQRPLDAELQSRAALFGLHAGGLYRAFAARPAPNESIEDLAFAVMRTGSRGSVSALVAEVEGRLVGVVAQRPSVPNPGTLVGLGREATLSELTQSYAEACRVLNAATFAERAGVLALSDVPLESAMLDDPVRSQRLAERYVGVLQEDTDASTGRILDTVRLWLECNGSIPQVAESLRLHPNTVRYRLQAYEDRTGERLTSFRSRVGAWWGLTWASHEKDDHLRA